MSVKTRISDGRGLQPKLYADQMINFQN